MLRTVFNRPGYGRVCVEVDLLEPLYPTILIQNGVENFPQPVIYERLSQFCTPCTILGQTLQTCRSATHSVRHVSFCSALPPLLYCEYIIDLGKGVGNIGPRGAPQTSIRYRPNIEMEMESPPQTGTKVVIPPMRASSTAPKSSPIRGRRRRPSALLSLLPLHRLSYILSKH